MIHTLLEARRHSPSLVSWADGLPATAPTQDSSTLQWETFIEETQLGFTEAWWRGILPLVRVFAIASIERALGRPTPTIRPVDRPLPTLDGPCRPTSLLFSDIRDAALETQPQLPALALAFVGPVWGVINALGRTLWTSDFEPAHPATCLELSRDGVSTFIWIHGTILLAVNGSLPMARRELPLPPMTNLSPPGVRWQWKEKPVPDFHTTALARRAEAWRRIFGPFLGSAAHTVLTEGFVIPRLPHALEPSYQANHPTTRNDPALIDRIVAKYLLGGVIEQVPRGHPPPMIIHPLGLVPKKSSDEPWRIIHDCRGDNATIVRLPTRLAGITASAYLFSRRALVFSLDLKAAYLSIPLRGCGGGLRKTGRRLHDGSPEYIMGCSTLDGSCTGGCDKDRLGFVWGVPYRLNATPFGMKVSGNGLELLTAPCVRRWARRGCCIILWVDDICFIIRVCHRSVDHPGVPSWLALPPGRASGPTSDLQDLFIECGGRASCPDCQRTFADATALREQVVAELYQLGWRTNEKDSGPPDTDGAFIGIPFDTVTFTFVLPADKRDKLSRRVAKVLRLDLVSRRRLAKLRGKLWWYGATMEYTLVMTRAMSSWIGSPTSDEAWDLPCARPAPLECELGFWRDHLVYLADRARLIIPLTGVQLHSFWLIPRHLRPQPARSAAAAAVLDVATVIYVDASVYGYGMARQEYPDSIPEVVVGTPLPDEPWEHQAHREAVALAHAAELAVRRAPGRTTILVSDCAPCVQALMRGSPSPELQACAARVARLAITSGSHLVPMWAPGKEMVDLGIDDLSRSAARALHDVALPECHFAAVTALATSQFGMGLSVDWFASAGTAKMARYWSRYADRDAEGIDAFLAPSWLASPCACGAWHREIGLFFPPVPLLGRTLARIKQEGACGVIVVPRTPGAPWWPVLEDCSRAVVALDIASSPFRSTVPLDGLYSSRKMTWQAHAFAVGPDPPTDSCARFRQVGAKPPFPSHDAALRTWEDTLRSVVHAPLIAHSSA